MKSYLIKDTTKQERIELIRQWVPADEAMEDCEIDLWDMYRDYIDGKKEIAQINAEFQANYFAGSLLAPEEELAGVLNAKFGGSMARNYWRMGREEFERIMREIRKFFKVSEQVVTRRMGEMVYGLEIPG